MPVKRKRSMSSFDVAAAVAEMESLVGGRLVNIYDLPGGGLLLRVRCRAGECRVAAVPAVRVHLTRIDIAEKGMPSPLVMGIRKHARDGRITGVRQLGFDRIAVLDVERGGERYSLVVETLPRGVYALLDGEGRILQVSEQRQMRDRVLRRGERYQPPPGGPEPPTRLDEARLAGLLSAGGEAARLLARGLGYPGEVVEEALARIGVEPAVDASTLRGRVGELLETFREIYRESLGEGGWLVYEQSGAPLTVVPFEPRGLAARYGLRVERVASFSEALDRYFGEELAKLEELEAVSSLEAERAKLLASLEKARENLAKLEERARRLEEDMRVIGENMQLVYEVYECVRRIRSRAGWDAVPGNCPGVVDVEPSRGLVKVNIGGRLVDLDVRLDPSRLLVEMSRKLGEIQAKIERGRKAVEDIEGRLEQLLHRLRQRAARARALVRRREWYEKYHWLVTRSGFLAIGGRDASQNESIVKRYLNEKRIFMHADIHGAPIVIVFAEGREPPEEDLRDAALLTAAYSKAWKAGMGAVDVYWVWGSQVSKSPPPGEYLARGAFMVYGKRNYIRAVELKLAVGVAEEEGAPLVIVGPPDLVERRSLVYAILVPGDEDPSKLAARLRRVFAGKVADDEKKGLIEALQVEELARRIPGRSRAIKVARGRSLEHPRPVKILPGEAHAESEAGGG